MFLFISHVFFNMSDHVLLIFSKRERKGSLFSHVQKHARRIYPESRALWRSHFLQKRIDWKAFDHVDRNLALKAVKEHGVGKQHLAWMSKLWEQHGLKMMLGHSTSRKIQDNEEAPKGCARKPMRELVLDTSGHGARSSELKMVDKK